MDFFLTLFLSAAGSTPPYKVAAQAQAQARITILRAYKASPESWDPAAKRNQREIVRRERDGSTVRLRLTEFE